MRQELKDLFLGAGAETYCGASGDLRPMYSGRGMYGDSTYAVVFDNEKDFKDAMVDIAFQLGIGSERGFEGEDEIADELKRLRIDNLGLSIVVY